MIVFRDEPTEIYDSNLQPGSLNYREFQLIVKLSCPQLSTLSEHCFWPVYITCSAQQTDIVVSIVDQLHSLIILSGVVSNPKTEQKSQGI